MIKRWLSAVPFKLLVPFIYLAYYLSILLLIVLSPLFILSRAVVCVLAWFIWVGPRQEILVVLNGESKSSEYLAQLEPLLEGRAIFLDYAQRQNWRWFSIPTQLFYGFGPKPIPERFMSLYLPAVILVKKFKWPKRFTFGARSKREENLAALRRELMSR
jgi:hypothetical protein